MGGSWVVIETKIGGYMDESDILKNLEEIADTMYEKYFAEKNKDLSERYYKWFYAVSEAMQIIADRQWSKNERIRKQRRR